MITILFIVPSKISVQVYLTATHISIFVLILVMEASQISGLKVKSRIFSIVILLCFPPESSLLVIDIGVKRCDTP